MKKMKMVIPALALAASMSMTAFAAGEAQQGQAVDTASSNLFEAGTASTQVKVVYTKDVSQLSATVPLSITFAVLSTGEFITPEGYGITNNSVVPIHVSEIKVSDIAEGYEFVANEDEVSGKKIRLQMQPENGSNSITLKGYPDGEAFKESDWVIETGSNNRLGITFSGGEPTLQAEALIPLFKELKANGIHICLDSNGGIWNEKVEELFSLTDLVLLDIKQFNPERHRTLTGRSNEQTLRTAAWLEEHERPFWLRYVLVPGYSDSEEDIRLLGESLGKYRQIQRVEILPYHRLGVHKYEAMGWDYKLKEVKENTPEQLERAEKLFKEYFTNVITN